MSWIKAKHFPLSQDLTLLDKALSHSHIPHRITEEDGEQVLWIPENTKPEDLESIVRDAQNPGIQSKDGENTRGNFDQVHSSKQSSSKQFSSNQLTLVQQAKNTPATSVFILLGIIGYLLMEVSSHPDITFIKLFFAPVNDIVQTGEVWRLLTPAFLHFGILHVLFNCLWMWELGRRLEIVLGLKKYFVVFLLIAIGANYIQFMISNYILFGGLSGVVYGFLALLLILSRYLSHPILRIPSGIYIFMIVFMFLGIFKVIDIFTSSNVANGAHVGGFVIGIVIGALMFANHRLKARR